MIPVGTPGTHDGTEHTRQPQEAVIVYLHLIVGSIDVETAKYASHAQVITIIDHNFDFITDHRCQLFHRIRVGHI